MKALKGILFGLVAFALAWTQTNVFLGAFDIDVSTGVKIGISVTSMFVGGGAGSLMVGVNKEIWLPLIMEGFYLMGEWITRSVDMSAFVEYDVINLAEAGVDPDVLINTTTFPIPMAQRTDAYKALTLDTYDSENTVVRNVEAMEVAYDKRASVTRQHQKAIFDKFCLKVAHSWCPNAHSALTPIIAATGADNGDGLKRMKLADILSLQKAFNKARIPQRGRCLLLCSEHLSDLLLEDKDLFKTYANIKEGSVARIYGFDTYVEEATPTFNKTTGVKVAFGAAPAPATDTHSSIAWQEDEVMRADGSVDMFLRANDPEQRGDVIGFEKRALGLPIREKGIGAIYSPAV
jgi:hypothetical protein